ncbi:MAG: nuclear transport factor 2 family protein [Saprospiraceae bacterium]|nr:nuclear transport factor 2 family protein [Saprospiraceae bacterium]
MEQREVLIRNYLDAYNRFDLNGMLAGFHETVKFANVSAGATTLELEGRAAFREQAERAAQFFSERRQTPLAFHHAGDCTEVDIDYFAVLAVDLPGGPAKGAELRLRGKSVFRFEGNQIVELTDIS